MRSPRRSIKVIHVFGSLGRGGAETRTLQLIRAAGGSGHVVSALASSPSDLEKEFVAAGVRIGPRGARRIRYWWDLYKSLRLANCVDSNVSERSGPVLMVAWLAGVPRRLAHFRSEGSAGTGKRTFRSGFLGWLISRFATEFVGVSPGAAEYGSEFCRLPVSCFRVVPTGVDTTGWDAPPEVKLADSIEPGSWPVIAHVGRDDPDKDRERTVRVFARLSKKYPRAQLVLAGRSLRSVEELCRSSGVASPSGIVDLGETSSVLPLLGRVDCLLHTSRREGLPGVVLEAISVGCPVVASDIPGVRYVAAATGAVGGLVDLSATDDDWAETVAALLASSQRRNSEVGANVSAFESSEFSIQAAVRRHRVLWGVHV